MKETYFDLVMLLERLHRLFLDVLKAELDRLKVQDLTNVQAVILYNIGKGHLTVGEVSNRGYYLGTNASYNLKKMVENNYIAQEISSHDRRSSRVKLSPKGLRLYESLDSVIEAQVENVKHKALTFDDINFFLQKGRSLESYWSFILSQEMRVS